MYARYRLNFFVHTWCDLQDHDGIYTMASQTLNGHVRYMKNGDTGAQNLYFFGDQWMLDTDTNFLTGVHGHLPTVSGSLPLGNQLWSLWCGNGWIARHMTVQCLSKPTC